MIGYCKQCVETMKLDQGEMHVHIARCTWLHIKINPMLTAFQYCIASVRKKILIRILYFDMIVNKRKHLKDPIK